MLVPELEKQESRQVENGGHRQHADGARDV